jgi:hypothetical protein
VIFYQRHYRAARKRKASRPEFVVMLPAAATVVVGPQIVNLVEDYIRIKPAHLVDTTYRLVIRNDNLHRRRPGLPLQGIQTCPEMARIRLAVCVADNRYHY